MELIGRIHLLLYLVVSNVSGSVNQLCHCYQVLRIPPSSYVIIVFLLRNEYNPTQKLAQSCYAELGPSDGISKELTLFR